LDYLRDKLELRYIIDHAGPRKEQLEIPEVALREAILNALAHRDYYEKGAVIMIEIYDDRVVISNPGPLVSAIPVEKFGKKSFSRNPLIFGLLTRQGLVEQIGSGISRMRKVMRDHGLPEPLFGLQGMFDITLYRSIDFDKWLNK
jgi:ATP-dependent DNA helicase RecG